MNLKILTLIFLLTTNLVVISQNSCIPSDSCEIAPFLNCTNGFISNLNNFTPSNNPLLCSNGQNWAIHNDLWIRFIPNVTNLEITVDILGKCTYGDGIQALIHENCNSDPIDCDVKCSGSPKVGNAINFIIGKEYYLRIDGCNGAICNFQITVNPSNAISNNSNSKLDDFKNIFGNENIICSTNKDYSYCIDSVNECISECNWIVESGNAIITNIGNEVIDNDSNHLGKNITLLGSKKNCVNVRFLDSGEVNLSVIGSNGCQYNNKIYKKIKVDKPPIQYIDIKLCPNIYYYENDSLNGGYFFPGFPCGTIERYDILRVDNNGCEYTTKLSVKQLCDSLFDLGDIYLCPSEKFRLCNIDFDSSNIGYNTVVCKAIPYQNGNINPPQCDSTYTFNIIPTEIIPNLTPKIYKLPCKNSKIKIDGSSSIFYPDDPISIKNLKFIWQYYDTINGIGWHEVVNGNKISLITDKPGKYRLIINLDLYSQNSKTGLKNCSGISNEVVIYSNDSLPIEKPFYEELVANCSGNPTKLKIINPDPNLKYYWIKYPQNDTVINTSLSFIMNTPYQIISIQAKSDCSQSELLFDTIYNISEAPINENLIIQGNNYGCIDYELGLKVINNKNYIFKINNNKNVAIRSVNDSIYLKFKEIGVFDLYISASNSCNTKVVYKSFYIDDTLPNIYIQGSRTVIEKSTNLYCININDPNLIVKWSVSKNLKYKTYHKSGQNCISVTFPSGISTGWIKLTINNNCIKKSDSILILSKPKVLFNERDNENEISTYENKLKDSSLIQTFPNPAINFIEIKGTIEYDEIEIIDILGKVMKMKNQNNIFYISTLNSGYYIIKILSNNRVISINSFIKL